MNAKMDLTSVQNWQNAKTQELIKTIWVVAIHVNARILLDMKWKVNHECFTKKQITVLEFLSKRRWISEKSFQRLRVFLREGQALCVIRRTAFNRFELEMSHCNVSWLFGDQIFTDLSDIFTCVDVDECSSNPCSFEDGIFEGRDDIECRKGFYDFYDWTLQCSIYSVGE